MDADGDGIPDGCDVEECDGLDNDGDGEIDEDLNCGSDTIDECQTAFSRLASDNAICFDNVPGFSSPRWGWTNLMPSTNGTTTLDLYAGAAQCDISKGALIGEVQVTYDNGSIDVAVSTVSGVIMNELQLYAGSEELPRDNQGDFTVAPGQYPYKYEPGNEFTSYTFSGIDVNGANNGYYLILHSEVCPEGSSVSRNVFYPEPMEVAAYPVKFKEDLNVEIDVTYDGQCNISIFDISGKRVKDCGLYTLKKGKNGVKLYVGDISTGLYYVQINSGYENRTLKVVGE